jgi:hypothetical protein
MRAAGVRSEGLGVILSLLVYVKLQGVSARETPGGLGLGLGR